MGIGILVLGPGAGSGRGIERHPRPRTPRPKEQPCGCGVPRRSSRPVRDPPSAVRFIGLAPLPSDLGAARWLNKEYPPAVIQTREYRSPEVCAPGPSSGTEGTVGGWGPASPVAWDATPTMINVPSTVPSPVASEHITGRAGGGLIASVACLPLTVTCKQGRQAGWV